MMNSYRLFQNHGLHLRHEQYLKHHRANQPPWPALPVSWKPLRKKERNSDSLKRKRDFSTNGWQRNCSYYFLSCSLLVQDCMSCTDLVIFEKYQIKILIQLSMKLLPGSFSEGFRIKVFPHVTATGNICIICPIYVRDLLF